MKTKPKSLQHAALRGMEKLKVLARKWTRQRSDIESLIGHAKAEKRLGRCYLHRKIGDKINAILSECEYNMRKLFRGASF